MHKYPEEFKDSSYELFIASLTVLSLINLVIYYIFPDNATTVVLFINILLSLIFMGDFLYRFFTAPSKSIYFIRQFGWADLASSLPFPLVKLIRIFRLFRVSRKLNETGSKKIRRHFGRSPAQSAFLSLAFMIILLLEFGSMAVLYFEADIPGSNIKDASDAIWYTFVTITTVGYGDQYPVSTSGRLMGMVIMIAGVSLFGTLTGYISNIFIENRRRRNQQRTQDDLIPMDVQMKELKSLLNQQHAIQDELEKKIEQLESDLIQTTQHKIP